MGVTKLKPLLCVVVHSRIKRGQTGAKARIYTKNPCRCKPPLCWRPQIPCDIRTVDSRLDIPTEGYIIWSMRSSMSASPDLQGITSCHNYQQSLPGPLDQGLEWKIYNRKIVDNSHERGFLWTVWIFVIVTSCLTVTDHLSGVTNCQVLTVARLWPVKKL